MDAIKAPFRESRFDVALEPEESLWRSDRSNLFSAQILHNDNTLSRPRLNGESYARVESVAILVSRVARDNVQFSCSFTWIYSNRSRDAGIRFEKFQVNAYHARARPRSRATNSHESVVRRN